MKVEEADQGREEQSGDLVLEAAVEGNLVKDTIQSRREHGSNAEQERFWADYSEERMVVEAGQGSEEQHVILEVEAVEKRKMVKEVGLLEGEEKENRVDSDATTCEEPKQRVQEPCFPQGVVDERVDNVNLDLKEDPSEREARMRRFAQNIIDEEATMLIGECFDKCFGNGDSPLTT